MKVVLITLFGLTCMTRRRLLSGKDQTTAVGTIVMAVAGMIVEVEVMTTGLIGIKIKTGGRTTLGNKAETNGTAETTTALGRIAI